MASGAGGKVVGGDAKYGELIRNNLGWRAWRALPNGKTEEREWRNQRRQDVEREFKAWHDEGKEACIAAEERRNAKREDRKTQKAKPQPVKDWVVQILDVKGIEYHDRRGCGGGNNGNLWVFGADKVPGLIDSLDACGAHLTYREDAGKQFDNRPAWWLKGYPKLRDDVVESPEPETIEETEDEAALDEDLQNLAISELRQHGWPQNDLALAFGLSDEAIAEIVESLEVAETEHEQVEATTPAAEASAVDRVFGIQVVHDGTAKIGKAFLSYEQAFTAIDSAMEAVKLFGLDDPRPDIVEIEVIG